ncbi:MAG: calcium/sodium antiporter [Treponema sp.]|nr:calcium/sodium antiporter [Candidatus Treponema caballi]
MLKAVILFAVGLVLLIKGGDWFVDGASGFAHRFHVPELLIGATVVSIGTTLPEVMVSSTSAVMGHSEIAYGNAIGSIICNTALIAALTMAIQPPKVNRKEIVLPVCFFFSAAALWSVVAYTSGNFSRLLGIVLLAIFATYMTVLIVQAVKASKAERSLAAGATSPSEAGTATELTEAGTAGGADSADDQEPVWKLLVMLVLGAACIAFGADLLVDNGTIIAHEMGVPESVIALTFVALGTSLPELVTAITSLVKKCGALSLGNIIGANLFNLVLVSGLSITLRPFSIPVEKTIAGMNASLVVDTPLMLLVMLIMTIPPLIAGKMRRWQGILLLALYAAFCTFQFVGVPFAAV